MDPGQLSEVEQLSRLVDLEAAAGMRARVRRWPILVCISLTGAILTVLATERVHEIPIDLDAVVSGLKFTLADGHPLLGNVELKKLTCYELRAVRAPHLFGSMASELATSVEIETLEPPDIGHGIAVEALRSAPGTEVVVEAGEKRGEYDLTLSQTPSETPLVASLSVAGKIRLRMNAASEPPLVKSIQADEITLFGARDVFRSTLTTGPGTSFRLLPSIPVRQLDLTTNLNVYGTEKRSIKFSSILSGKIHFTELEKDRQLSDFERLNFTVLKGEIRSVVESATSSDSAGAADASGRGAIPLRLRFSGTVANMEIGADSSPPISLMPTWIEWLAARKALWLSWAALVYVTGSAFVVLQYLRVEPQIK